MVFTSKVDWEANDNIVNPEEEIGHLFQEKKDVTYV